MDSNDSLNSNLWTNWITPYLHEWHKISLCSIGALISYQWEPSSKLITESFNIHWCWNFQTCFLPVWLSCSMEYRSSSSNSASPNMYSAWPSLPSVSSLSAITFSQRLRRHESCVWQPDLQGALTFSVVANVLVAHLQVDVVLPALRFAALQPTLGSQTRRHLLHVEAENEKKKGRQVAMSVRKTCRWCFSRVHSPVHERQRAQHAKFVVCSRHGDVGWIGEHYS